MGSKESEYVEVTFHVHKEDLVRGLTVVLLQTEEGLIPFTWVGEGRDDRPNTITNREGTNVVDVEVYGGTKEQFERQRKQHTALLARRGKEVGVYAHFPSNRDPLRLPIGTTTPKAVADALTDEQDTEEDRQMIEDFFSS